MESYPIDADAEQVVRRLMAEQAAGSLPLRLNARRLAEVQQIPLRRELHLGDEEREDLSEVAMIGMLEIAPLHASDGWCLDGPEGEAHLARLLNAIETNSHPNGHRGRKH